MGWEHEPETVWKAQELYCVDRLSFARVAELTGVTATTLKSWSEKYGWRAKREEIAQAESDIRVKTVLNVALFIPIIPVAVFAVPVNLRCSGGCAQEKAVRKAKSIHVISSKLNLFLIIPPSQLIHNGALRCVCSFIEHLSRSLKISGNFLFMKQYPYILI